jgi:multicomponent Na+:H+ antiporter subunit B
VDVAFTEAAVGAGITLTLMLAALSLTTRYEARKTPGLARRALALVVACTIAIALGYAMFGLPNLGDAAAQMHHHVAPRYIEMAQAETSVPNIVTAVLASYRGYDTLGETTVIFTAGISVMALLWRWRTDRT